MGSRRTPNAPWTSLFPLVSATLSRISLGSPLKNALQLQRSCASHASRFLLRMLRLSASITAPRMLWRPLLGACSPGRLNSASFNGWKSSLLSGRASLCTTCPFLCDMNEHWSLVPLGLVWRGDQRHYPSTSAFPQRQLDVATAHRVSFTGFWALGELHLDVDP